MATPQNTNAACIDRFLRLLEAEDFNAWGELFTENAVQENPFAPADFPARFVGRRAIIDHYAKLPEVFERMRFPDLVVHQTEDPNVAIAEFRGDIQLKGSARKYDNTYITVFEFDAAGRIRRTKEYFNPTVLSGSKAFGEGGVLGVPSDSPDRTAWAQAFFADVDSRDTARIVRNFTPDVRLRFGNADTLKGRDTVVGSFAETAGKIRGVHHEIRGLWTGRDINTEVVCVEADVTYTLPDKPSVTVPCTSTLRLRGDLIADYRIFIDVAPVFGNTC